MKYYLLNPVFIEAPIEISNREAIYGIDEKLKENEIETGNSILIKINKMFFKLVLKEKNETNLKFELTSNVYV